MSTTLPPQHLTAADAPAVPLTIEGASVLHQMFRIRWSELRGRDCSAIAEEAAAVVGNGTGTSWSAAFRMLGHKADLMLVHFRDSFEALQDVQTRISRMRLSDYLEPTSSYLSVVELGLYESTGKTYAGLVSRGVAPHSPEWNEEIENVLARQREAMKSRLFPELPPHRYICFYPMDRRRGEQKNWYQESMADRQRMMHEHGMVGRRYAGEVRQIITGSIGFDDWEWGVTLFADDPLVFKKLIYEMRFDEVSAVYALFGTFWVGSRIAGDGWTSLIGPATEPRA